MPESRGRYELGHMNLSAAEATSRLDKRLKRDRRGDHHPEYGVSIGPGISEEICGVLAALAEAKAQERRDAFEEAAREIQHQARSMRLAGIPCDANEIKASTALSLAATIRARATAPAETEKPETGEAFQARALTLFEAAIGDDPSDLPERVARFAEEALELAQALHMTEDDARRVLEYVFGRPRGEPAQEFGGTLATLAVLASYAGEDLMRCGEADIARWADPAFIARLRMKRAGRHGRGPLPGATPPQPTATNTLEDGHA